MAIIQWGVLYILAEEYSSKKRGVIEVSMHFSPLHTARVLTPFVRAHPSPAPCHTPGGREFSGA